MNRIDLMPINIQSPRNENEFKLLNEIFDKVSKISYIKNLNKQITEALDTIIKRKSFIEKINKDVIDFYNEIQNSLIEIFNTDDFSFIQIDNEIIDEEDMDSINLIKFNVYINHKN